MSAPVLVFRRPDLGPSRTRRIVRKLEWLTDYNMLDFAEAMIDSAVQACCETRGHAWPRHLGRRPDDVEEGGH